MKLRLVALLTALAAAASLATACNKYDKESSSSDESSKEQVMSADENAVPANGAKPVLALEDVEGAPGEEVEVTMSISGADQKWSSCGIHITFDERLTCLATEEDTKRPVSTPGEAVYELTGISMLQVGDDRNEHLINENKSAVFFCAAGNGDFGGDGDIVTYTFKIPDDAKSGTVYELGFYYREGDMFRDINADMKLQDYAFSHWQGGSITVK